MKIKYLSGAYPGGYTLGATYTGLVIESTATVGGSGVSASALATIVNYGAVQATSGFADGVSLKAGGTVTNGSATDTTALITGFDGVLAFGFSAITNYGAIQGPNGAGVALAAGGSLTNGSATDTTASVSGNYGVSVGYPTATIANFGSIQGHRVGVTLAAGGTVTNGTAADITALILGTGAGGFLFGLEARGSATVANFGTIEATNGNGLYPLGVYLYAGGSVTNGSAADTTALIAGARGLVAHSSAAATVINFGTIEGTVGAAVAFSSAADRLIVENGAAFVGVIAGGGGTLELAGGADTITGLGGSAAMTGSTSAGFSGFGSYLVDAGASLTLTGTVTLTTGQSLTVAGSLTNTATLTAPAAGGAAVYLSSGGSVTNGSAADTTALITGSESGALAQGASATVVNFGTISGSSGYGVDLKAGGTATNGSASDIAALIEGSSGVVASGASVTIANYGTIEATGASSASYGVHLTAGGTVTNGAAGDITALIEGATGVSAQSTSGTVANFGTIQGQNGYGVLLNASGSVTNGSAADTTALITGSESGALAQGASATVVNFGTISGSSGYGVDLKAGGTATNGSASDIAALIEGSSGVVASGASVTIANYGTIEATGASSASYGVHLTAGGTVTNGAAGDITALIEGATGVSAQSTSGTVANFGTIQGQNGYGVLLNASGSVTNGSAADTTALITGSESGAFAQGASATVVNFGTIQGQGAGYFGVRLAAGGSVTNGSASDITALIEGSSGVLTSGASATVANFGTIQSTGPNGSGVDLAAGGTVTNGAAGDITALIEGKYGVLATGAAAETVNYGTIQGGAAGVSLSAGGTVINGSATYTAASIAGGPYGIAASGLAATIANYGAIQGGNAGVSLSAGGTVTNGSAGDTTALITGGYGIAASGLAVTIANFGAIQGGGGVWLQAGGAVTNGSAADTGASIGGFADGILAAGGPATIANYGTIQGAVQYGVSLAGGGTVTNGSATDTNALVTGFHAGVNARGASAKVINYGAIRATANFSTGVYLYAGGGVTNGSATDAAALIKAFRGVYAGAVGAVTVTNFGTITGTGGTAVQFESSSDVLVVEAGCAFQGAVLGDGGTLALAGGVGTISDLTGGNVTVSGSMATTTFSNFGDLRIRAGAQFTLTGSGSIASGGTRSLAVNGTLTVTGNLIDSGTIYGSGNVTLAGGSLAVNAGAQFFVANWSLNGGIATVNRSLTYNGAFSEGAGGTLTLGAGDLLALTGADTLSGVINGSGRVKLSKATTSGVAIGGTAIVEDAVSVQQTGQITVGDGTSNVAAVVIDAGATWTIENNSGFTRGLAANSGIRNRGTLIKSGGAGVSVIGVSVLGPGSIVALSGTLDLTKAVTATSLTVDSGATLELDSSAQSPLFAPSTLSMTFNGANGTLALGKPSVFAAVINGFAPTDTIDLLARKATSATLGAGDTLVIKNRTVTIATLQLAGDYTGATFIVASDGHGGSAITVTGAARVAPSAAAASPAPSTHALIAAMASLGATAASASVATAHVDAWRPTLLAPRAQSA